VQNTFGEFCEQSSLDGTDPCKTKPCYNEGKCVNLDSISYKCMCNDSYGGTSCKQNALGSCRFNKCQRESICVPLKEDGKHCLKIKNCFLSKKVLFFLDYKCNCVDWTLGKNCEVVFDPCQNVNCANGVCKKRRTLAYEWYFKEKSYLQD
jgi:hypothetical protein